MKDSIWFRGFCAVAAAVFLTACMPGTISALAAGEVWLQAGQAWHNEYFAIDDAHLYENMTFPADKDGKIYMTGKDMTVYLPLLYLPEDSRITDDFLRVSIEADSEASQNMDTLKYELTAKKCVSRTNPARQAWLIQWHPDLKEQTVSARVRARISIRANIMKDNGPVMVQADEELLLVFRNTSGSTGETDSAESGSGGETQAPGTGESETGGSGETQAPGTGESESGGDGGVQPSDTGESESGSNGASDLPLDGNPGLGDGMDPSNGIVDPGGVIDTSGGAVTWGGGGSGEEDPQAPPKLRILDCTLDRDEIHPGDTVEIQVTLKNTSAASGVEDVGIVYESANGEVLPVNTVNSIYVDRIRAGGTCQISFPMEVGYTLTSDSQRITLTMEFSDDSAQALTSTENIFLKITPSFDVVVDQPSMASSVESGSAQDITINVYNTGGSPVKNVICSLEMDGVTPAGSAFGGDIEAGQSASVVLHTLIGKLSAAGTMSEGDASGMAAENGSENAGGQGSGSEGTGSSLGQSPEGSPSFSQSSSGYGQTTGTVYVRYEDEAGNEYTRQVSVTTQIVPPEGEEIQEETVEKSSQWWVSIVIALIMIQAVIFILMRVHRRRNV